LGEALKPLPATSVPRLQATCVAALGFLLAACQEGQSPPAHKEPPPGDVAKGSMLERPLDLVYVCGNRYLVTNASLADIQVTYRVANSKESGDILLRAGLNEDPGHTETELITSTSGTVELFQGEDLVVRRQNEGVPCGAQGYPAERRRCQLR